MRAGRLDLRVDFHRRALVPGRPHDRGDFEPVPYLADVPAEYRRLSGSETLEGGRLSDVEQGTLLIRDTPEARTITAADRVRFEGRDFAIKTVPVPVRRLRRIEINVALEMGD
jgi:head-tail adaptor